jgi:hypothetical protein
MVGSHAWGEPGPMGVPLVGGTAIIRTAHAYSRERRAQIPELLSKKKESLFYYPEYARRTCVQ